MTTEDITTGEGIEREPEIVSPEVEAVENIEVSVGQVLEHAAKAEKQIDEQAVGILLEAEQKIESNAKSMGISPEMLGVVKQEVGVGGHLAEIGVEVFRFADEAKKEVGAITEGGWTKHEDGVMRNKNG